MRNVLCLFTRTPRSGACKTRLIPRLGAEGACAAHKELVEGQLKRVHPVRAHKSLWVTELDGVVSDWAARFGYQANRQTGADLGARMLAAFAHEFALGGDRIVLIGGDCPDIDARYVTQAFSALAAHDLVLGPAEDGGYGLIGLKTLQPGLFQGINWGSGEVRAKTLELARQLHLSAFELSEIWDVDTPLDWDRYLAERRSESDSGN